MAGLSTTGMGCEGWDRMVARIFFRFYFLSALGYVRFFYVRNLSECAWPILL